MTTEASGFQLYKAIIKPLRDSDATELLKRFLVGPQVVFERTELAIQSLYDQVKPDKVDSELLQYLKDIVGFTNELRAITDRLDESQLRRLIQLAVPLWKQRHTKTGLINAIRLLTGRTAFVTDWFGYRMLLGEVTLTEDQLAAGGDPWIIGGSVSTYDEQWSNIRLMDDGTLDELMLLDVCRLMRPAGERMEIFLNDFLDKFNDELDKWTLVPFAGSYPVMGDGTLIIHNKEEAQPIVPILAADSDHVNYNIVAKFKLDAGADFVAKFYGIAGDRYDLRVKSTGVVSVTRYIASVSTIIFTQTITAISIIAGVWYKVRISVNTLSATVRSIRVLIDGNQVVPDPDDGSELLDTPGSGLIASGPYGFYAAGVIQIDNVESWRNPARFAIIGLSTASEPGGAATVTDNFVQ